MNKFIAQNGSSVTLSEKRHSFKAEPTHVIVICVHNDTWLLTNHKSRGLEFPGGKLENGETLEDTAIREVYEETGAKLKKLMYLGEYQVTDDAGTFVKAIYYGEVEELMERTSYHETNGPIHVKGNILEDRFNDNFSFIMKDQVIEYAVHKINELKEKGIL